MPSKQIAVDELAVGMYVEALDRSWLETDFTFQGLTVASETDIERLRAACEHVYVSVNDSDMDHADGDSSRSGRTSKLAEVEIGRGGRRDRTQRSFSRELEQARRIRTQTSALISDMHADIRAGREVDTGSARDAVGEMMDSVSRHPDALLWFSTLKSRDEYTAQHSMHVAMLAITFATHMQSEQEVIEKIGVGALLHDVGKIKVPLEILNKPGKLTDAEFAEIKKHPDYGVEILAGSHDLSQDSIDMVRSHHERVNGSGYPRGLTGGEISRFSQMLAIVDVYDAMTSDRVYHQGRSPAEVLARMRSFEGDFNPELFDKFVACIGDYPVGTLVELNTGEVGFVVPSAVRGPKPTVMIVLDHNKRRYFPQRLRNLADFPRFKIVRAVAAGDYGIDVDDYAAVLE